MNHLEGEDIYSELIRYFDIYDFNLTPQGYTFRFHKTFLPLEEIKTSLEKRGYYLYLRRRGEENIGILVRFVSPPPESPRLIYILLGLTLLTTTWAGWMRSVELVRLGYLTQPWIGALSFSLSLLFILGSHELGHKMTSIRYRIHSSGPFFIPVPPFIFPLGTLGAVIKMKSPVPDRNASINLGASGPITGFLFTLPILFVGLKLSFPVDLSSVVKGKEVIVFGEPLLFVIMKKIIFDLPPDRALLLHPLAFSGWVGLFVTALNLIPLGQLDGGHVMRALLGPENFRRMSAFVIGVLFVAGMLYWEGWLIWAFLGLFFTLAGNPGPLDELTPIRKREKILAGITLLIFLLSFIPVPVKIMTLG